MRPPTRPPTNQDAPDAPMHRPRKAESADSRRQGGESAQDNGGDSEDWGEAVAQQVARRRGCRPQIEASATSLREHLMEQMRLAMLGVRDRALVELIVDALDDNGYLTESLEEIAERMPAELEIDPDELKTALSLLQSFDPAGVGARSAAECLALQIRRMPGVPMVTRRMALAIVGNHLTWFAQREFNKLKKALDCDDEDLREAQSVIRQCNPHPGAGVRRGRCPTTWSPTSSCARPRAAGRSA